MNSSQNWLTRRRPREPVTALLQKIKRSWPKFQVDAETHKDWEAGLAQFSDESIWYAAAQINAIHKYESPPRLGVVVEFLNEQRPPEIDGRAKELDHSGWVFWNDENKISHAWHPDMRREGEPYPQPPDWAMKKERPPWAEKSITKPKPDNVHRLIQGVAEHLKEK